MSIINLKNPTDLSGFYVIYKGSTNLEKKGIYGISHLMEHLVCKALDPYQDELDRLGISQNAYTSGNEVVFHMKGLDKSISKWRNKFVDLLGQFEVTKEEFENERNIVLQEYMDSFNDQAHNHWLNLDRKRYNSFNPIGSKEDLENLTWMDCLNYFETQYSHPSSIINVSKNIEFGADMEFKTAKQNRKFKVGDYPATLQRDNDYKGKVSLIMSSDLVDGDFNKINFVNNMLSSGLQSPFYKEIREKKGLVYYIGSSLQRMNTQGSNAIYTMSSAENIDKIVDIVDTIFKSSDKFLTKDRFDVVKESMLITKEKQDINRYASVNKWINPDGWSVFDVLDTITYEETLEIAKKYFDMNNYTVSRDDQEFK
tara:strand:- start:1983 stop:3089 length:1107 start_codon:yes stop_codon:yes gene_type:complete